MNTNIEMDKVDYSQNSDILKELYGGGRQIIEAKWEDFFNIPVNEGYKIHPDRKFISTSEISGNVIDDNNRQTASK